VISAIGWLGSGLLNPCLIGCVQEENEGLIACDWQLAIAEGSSFGTRFYLNKCDQGVKASVKHS
jgi:hypothetical protein